MTRSVRPKDPFYGLSPVTLCTRLLGRGAEVTSERSGTVYGNREALFESVNLTVDTFYVTKTRTQTNDAPRTIITITRDSIQRSGCGPLGDAIEAADKLVKSLEATIADAQCALRTARRIRKNAVKVAAADYGGAVPYMILNPYGSASIDDVQYAGGFTSDNPPDDDVIEAFERANPGWVLDTACDGPRFVDRCDDEAPRWFTPDHAIGMTIRADVPCVWLPDSVGCEYMRLYLCKRAGAAK